MKTSLGWSRLKLKSNRVASGQVDVPAIVEDGMGPGTDMATRVSDTGYRRRHYAAMVTSRNVVGQR